MRDDTFATETGAEGQVGVTDAARKVTEGLGDLRRALSGHRESVVEPTAQFIQEQPLAAVAIAFGVGYVLGGGLFTKTTGRLIGLSWKLGGMALAKKVLGNLGGSGEGI